MKEIWKNIPEYEGYQVSNLGRIRTFNKVTYTNKHGERHWNNRILKQKRQKRNYGNNYDYRVDLWKNGEHKTMLVSRLVAFTFNNLPLNSNLTVDHLNGNSLDNTLTNLEIISRQENINRAFEKGLNTCCKKIKIISKKTLEEKEFYSMANASKYINKGHGYISNETKKGRSENKDYIWKML